MMKAVHPCVVAATVLLLPADAFAQRSGDPAYIEGRLTGLQQQLADQLQERLDGLRAEFKTATGSLE